MPAFLSHNLFEHGPESHAEKSDVSISSALKMLPTLFIRIILVPLRF